MSSSCVRCHGASDTAGGVRLDSQSRVKAQVSSIDRESAGGPAALNTRMPESGNKPSDSERKQLGEWLACGAN